MNQNLELMMSVWTSIAIYHTTKTKRRTAPQLLKLLKSDNAEDVRRFFAVYVDLKEVPSIDETFFSKHLPQVGKDILAGISTGRYVNNSVFTNQRHSRPLPQIFFSVLSPYFSKKGLLRTGDFSDLSITLQLFMTYYKFELPFSEETLANAKSKFIEDDRNVKTDGYPTTGPHSVSRLREIFSVILPDDPWDIRPHHSNGATNTNGVSNLGKRIINRSFPDLELSPYAHFLNDREKTASNSLEYLYSRVTFVPKDSRGPRTISMEPHERMALQKGLHAKIVEFQEEHCDITRGHINYTDQSINQRLAYESSMSGLKATIDLKDASDMVPWNGLRTCVPPEYQEALSVLRSPSAYVDDKLIPLNKFTSMGSALCFPMMASFIWGIAYCYDRKSYIYGDDLICDALAAPRIMSALEDYGLRINHDKSFLKGPFRESCGGDFVSGYDVGYIKCKSHNITSFVEMCNLFTQKYSSDLGDRLINIFEDYNSPVFRLPLGSEPTACCYNSDFLSSNDVFFSRKWDEDIQSFLYLHLQPSTIDLDSDLFHDLRKANKYVERKNRSATGPYLPYHKKPVHYYNEWMTQNCGYNSPVFDSHFYNSCRDTFYADSHGFKRTSVLEALSGNGGPRTQGLITFKKAKEKLSFLWGNHPALQGICTPYYDCSNK